MGDPAQLRYIVVEGPIGAGKTSLAQRLGRHLGAQLLLEQPEQFPRTVTEKLMAYAIGRRLDYYDRPAVRTIVRNAAAQDYRWSSLILGIVKSPTFLTGTLHTATN